MLDLADELGLPLNLGGGVAPGDGLEEFKRGFANAELPFLTHEVVCDRGGLRAALPAGVEAGGFFPAYRARAEPARSRRRSASTPPVASSGGGAAAPPCRSASG